MVTIPNLKINDQVTSSSGNNTLLSKEKIDFKKNHLNTLTLNNTPYMAKILNRAGKTTSLQKNSFNVEYKQPDDTKNKEKVMLILTKLIICKS